MKLITTSSVLALSLVSGRAHADDTPREIFQQVAMYDGWAKRALADAYYEDLREDPAECRKLIEAGEAAGIKASDTYDDGDTTYLWKRVGPICDRYEALKRLAPVAKLASDAISLYATLRYSYESSPDMTIAPGDAAQGKTCVAAIDAAVAGGVPDDFTIRIGYPIGENKHGSLTDARTLCQDYTDWSVKTGLVKADRDAAAERALRAKYKGVKGDRLKYLMETDNRFVMGKGCVELSVAAKKKAKVLYEMQEGDTYWVVYKMTFKRDKLIKTTERRFNKATSDGWTCK